MRSKRSGGFAPVVTTVIIVAVGIPIAIAVGIWLSHVFTAYAMFEKLEISNAWASMTDGTFTIEMELTNTGYSDTTITQVMINHVSYDLWNGARVTPAPSIPAPVGKNIDLKVQFPDKSTNGDAVLTSGVTVTMTLRTSDGANYPVLIVLP